jgi:hypothetical protein
MNIMKAYKQQKDHKITYIPVDKIDFPTLFDDEHYFASYLAGNIAFGFKNETSFIEISPGIALHSYSIRSHYLDKDIILNNISFDKLSSFLKYFFKITDNHFIPNVRYKIILRTIITSLFYLPGLLIINFYINPIDNANKVIPYNILLIGTILICFAFLLVPIIRRFVYKHFIGFIYFQNNPILFVLIYLFDIFITIVMIYGCLRLL